MSAPSSPGLVRDALLMPVSTPIIDRSRPAAGVELEDRAASQVSQLKLRAGVKGPGTADWLGAIGLPLPNMPNRWLPLPQGGLIARLGQSEYLIDGDSAVVDKVMSTARSAGVYPVLRQDATFFLSGSQVNALLLQTCNVDFRALEKDPSQLIMTSMVGVSVTVIFMPSVAGAPSGYRIWCDGTYGAYLKETLAEVIAEMAGGVLLEVLQ